MALRGHYFTFSSAVRPTNHFGAAEATYRQPSGSLRTTTRSTSFSSRSM